MKCNYKRIYILCPKKYASGGPDALHQLAYYIKKIGFKDVYMVYTDLKRGECGLNKTYEIYGTKSIRITEVVDSVNTLVIIPENLYRFSCLFKKSNISIWWLSVDNFVKKLIKHDSKQLLLNLLNFDIDNALIYFKLLFSSCKKNCNHFAASYYANNFLKKNSINSSLLIEPISLEFLNEYRKNYKKKNDLQRKKQILYNPRKGYEVTKEIIQNNNQYNFVPLSGYSFKELVDLYKTSTLYIDFGSFPGAERIPKEAVLFGCNIITGKHGASKFYNDVCIPDKWKFDDGQLSDISKAIEENIENYDKYYPDFDAYRERVLKLESEFICNLKSYLFR